MRFPRHACRSLAPLLVAVALATPLRAQTVPPAVAAQVQRVSPWDITTTLRASAGWRNNVTISAFHPIDRAFWRAEAEAFALRPIGQHAQFLSLFSGDTLRYFSPPPGVSGEQQWVGHLEGRWTPRPVLRASLKADGFLQTTFIDPSQTEGAQEPPLRVRIRGAYATFTPRVTLPWGFIVEPSVQVKRISYVGYNGDYRELRPGIRLEWKQGEHFALSAAWYDHLRHYDELTQSTAGNRALRGWLLSLHQREGEVKATTAFDAHGAWTVAASAGRLENRDRAFGYLDYNQDRAQLEVNWSHRGWRATASGDARRLDYLVQQVGTGVSRPARVTDAYELSARLERDLNATWTAFIENRWERNRSNVTDDAATHPFSYRANTALLGLQRTF